MRRKCHYVYPQKTLSFTLETNQSAFETISCKVEGSSFTTDSDTGQLSILMVEIVQMYAPHYFFPSIHIVNLKIATKAEMLI